MDEVLSGVNLSVRPGEYVALAGPSGVGKTTLCSLIPRFYEVTGGSIKIDGTDIKDVTLKSLRDHIGVVQQDVYLFMGTIKENIRYGKPDATDEEVIQAAKLANAHDFIMSFENGYDTDIGQRGVKLSGGQKQRLSIARVFLKNPPILIFDEATSALDNESEQIVQESLEKLAKNRTTFVIAHRLTTIENAEEILMLTDEGIKERGTHEELSRKMEFALRMLLSNAFKNTFVYGKVTLDISVVNENGKAYSALVVTDEGLDEDESTRRGLKQIMDMADAIGGMYRSESDKNGTSYIIMIPLGKQHLLDRRVEFVEPESDLVKLNARQKEEIAELIHVIPQKKETGKKLLVIDDSDQIRWFLKHVFNKEYQILEARNGQDGINVALKEEPDLILCDVMMPVKDGYETCREIKNDPKMAQTPVVMLTAKVESEDVITGIEAGADDYITDRKSVV